MAQQGGKRVFKKTEQKTSGKKVFKKERADNKVNEPAKKIYRKEKPIGKTTEPVKKVYRKEKPIGKTTELEKKVKPLKKTEGDRLNKYIANAGICSRREADKYIEAGLVSINGKVITELGTKVFYGDKVKLNEATIMPEKKTYVLLNKPKDYVTTLEDPHAKRTVIDLIRNGCKERVYPVGRLDKATTGLLLLTNDGDLAEQLAHPKNNKKKIYQATLDKVARPEDLQKLLSGITLEDGPTKVDEIIYCNPEDKSEIGVEIHSGKNRIIRRMFEHLGYNVKKLDRVYYAGLTKKNLPRGKWRFLNEKEIIMLKRGAF